MDQVDRRFKLIIDFGHGRDIDLGGFPFSEGFFDLCCHVFAVEISPCGHQDVVRMEVFLVKTHDIISRYRRNSGIFGVTGIGAVFSEDDLIELTV